MTQDQKETVALRSYTQIIQGLIDQFHSSEAASHCLHILQIYPKHVDTYRQLGEIYLEQERYLDAANILNRVLSVVPDDFIAHLGLSVINEHHRNLQQAIWHMERAFDYRPTLQAIKSELSRLYGLRDGIEPTVVNLTRPALARLYMRGGLLPQAIYELEDLLKEDGGRNELRVLLAEALLLNEQEDAAIETATHIVEQLPYCMMANRILAYAQQDQPPDAPTRNKYHQRLVELDPYYEHVSQEWQTPEAVPGRMIMVPWLGQFPMPEIMEPANS